MNESDQKPTAVFLKGLEIYRAICAGNSTVEAVVHATGLPATTILRVSALLVDDERIEAHVANGQLRLTMRFRFNPDAFS
jgi:DNA-binding IclR family transcriptional regulator